MIGIYKITNPKGRIYIGQSIDIEKRFNLYKILSCYKQRRLYSSFKKHGVENHLFEIVELCSIEYLNEKERYWQDFYDVISPLGMNCVLQGTKEKRRLVSNEMKQKISVANSGKNNGMYGRELSASHLEVLRNLKHTEESKALISKRSEGGNNPNAKLVLNLETGIFYGHVGEAAKVIGVKRDTLKQWLNGRRTNKTSFIYC